MFLSSIDSWVIHRDRTESNCSGGADPAKLFVQYTTKSKASNHSITWQRESTPKPIKHSSRTPPGHTHRTSCRQFLASIRARLHCKSTTQSQRCCKYAFAKKSTTPSGQVIRLIEKRAAVSCTNLRTHKTSTQRAIKSPNLLRILYVTMVMPNLIRNLFGTQSKCIGREEG